MLTPQERERICEEERVRREVPRKNTPTDWLASCILAPIIVGVTLIVILFLLIAMIGIFR